MVPEGWRKDKVSNILERVILPVNVEANKLYREIGIRSHGKGIFYKEPVTGKSLGDKRVFHIEPNCFVVNIVFAWEHAIAKTTDKEIGMIASHRFPMYRPKNNSCDIDYILYLFKTKYGKYLLGLASPGGAGRNKTLGQNEFARLSVLLPPVEEQIKIAAILATWDKAIEIVEKLIEKSEMQKKGLMQILFTMNKRFPGFIGNWKSKSLASIALVIMGSSPKSSAYNDNSIGLPLIQGNADIKNRVSAPRHYTSEITKECMEGDVLLSVRAPVGAISISKHHACIGRGIAAIRANKNISQRFIYHWLINFEPNWPKLSQGSTFEAVNRDDVKLLKLSIPELDEQEKIASILSIAEAEIELYSQQLDQLKQERQALVQNLLSGKIRVNING